MAKTIETRGADTSICNKGAGKLGYKSGYCRHRKDGAGLNTTKIQVTGKVEAKNRNGGAMDKILTKHHDGQARPQILLHGSYLQRSDSGISSFKRSSFPTMPTSVPSTNTGSVWKFRSTIRLAISSMGVVGETVAGCGVMA